MQRNARTTPSGFSLLEVLFAVALLAIVLLAIAPLFTLSMISNAVGWDYTEVNSLARQELEQVLQYGFYDARLAVPDGATITFLSGSPPGQIYTNQLSVTQVVNGKTVSFPYQMVYTVQDFPPSAMPAGTDLTVSPVAVSLPSAASAVTDSYWTSPNTGAIGYKVITVYAVSARKNQGSPLSTSGIFSGTVPGKQIRLAAYKVP